jgi:dipeptidyl aminopeptidase/acylaminoacyl peptidase
VWDCVNGARHLATRGLADAKRYLISGASAGGFTALAALAHYEVFRAGTVYYGLSELESAMRDTHKFEAGYGDWLLGPWPEAREIYRKRSPLYAADSIRAPVLFFQGLKDKVVPPEQTARMVAALRRNRVPVASLSFPEEGHGFRRAETLQRCLEAELAFHARLLGFTPADALRPLQIENLG